MAKLILSFKGHLLSVHHLDESPMTIGRDLDCRIAIDSLAIAPRHAEMIPIDTGSLLLALDPEYPVLLNNEQVDQATLHHGDMIQVGKHTLEFSEDSFDLVPNPVVIDNTQVSSTDEAGESASAPVPAYMQFQSGPKIGRVIVFRRSVTRLSRAGAEDVIVTRRGHSYHLSRLGGKYPIKIAGTAVGDQEMELHHNDIIEVGDRRLRFFCVEAEVPTDDA